MCDILCFFALNCKMQTVQVEGLYKAIIVLLPSKTLTNGFSHM